MAEPSSSSSSSPSASRYSQSAFVKLIALDKVTTPTSSSGYHPKIEIFRSRRPLFTPSYYPAAFGGHVYAQSAWAAAQTVSQGFVLH
ncbi:hypothetical protein KEM54_003212, partial [Ascosphaera aggregata]